MSKYYVKYTYRIVQYILSQRQEVKFVNFFSVIMDTCHVLI